MPHKKNTVRSVGLVAASIALLSMECAYAGGSLFVDDASVTPIEHCQVENWVRGFSNGQELAAAPACNFGGVELGATVSQFFDPRVGPLVNLGAKYVWGNFEQTPFGMGASVGATWNADTRSAELWTVNIPASFAIDRERNWLLHVNVGWLDIHDVSGGLTGGLGVEHVLTDNSVLLAEIYVQYDGVCIGQAGLRRTVNEYLNVDVFMGHIDNVPNGPWFATLGLNISIP